MKKEKRYFLGARGWWPNLPWNPGADRWTWINGAIDDTARKAVKTRISTPDIRVGVHVGVERHRRLDGGWHMRVLAEIRIQRRAWRTRREEKKRAYAPREWKDTSALSPTLTWQSCAIKTPWRTIRSGISASQTNFVETSVEDFFISVCARGAWRIYFT